MHPQVSPNALMPDIPRLMMMHYQHLLHQARKRRQEWLESALADPNVEEKTVKGLIR